MNNTATSGKQKRLDLTLMIAPFLVICLVASTFFIWPEGATNTLYTIREFINTWFSSWICLIGIAAIGITIYFAASPLGKITLGDPEKAMSRFQWGAIVFTTTMGADLLFFGICEWTFYADDPYLGTLGGTLQDWIPTMSLFHWGPTVWSFLLVMSVVFGFMMHVRGTRSRRLSEACRPLLGKKMDGPLGRLFDILTILSIYAGVAASVVFAVPTIGGAIGDLFGFNAGAGTFIFVALLIGLIYAVSALIGMKSISWFSSACVWLFLGLLAYTFLFSGRAMFMLETAITTTGNLANNFLKLSTQLDPLRETGFPQNWTLFYWAYWLSWSVGAPFFIAQISHGRTIRQVIVEGYAWGVAGSWIGFFIMGNYGMSLQFIDGMPISSAVMAGEDTTSVVLTILKTLPLPQLVVAVVAVVMTLLITTSLDSTTLIASAFSEPDLDPDELPSRKGRVFWAILLIVLPIALLFAEGSLNNVQSIAIIFSLPISVILLLATAGFIKDAKRYLAGDRKAEKKK